MATARNAKSRKPAQVDEEPDLLAGLEDAPEVKDEEESEDLLDGISEDNGVAWMPWEEDDQPKGIQGRVTYIGTVESDYGDNDVPLIELEDKAGDLWSIRGYSTALQSQIKKTDPQVGDLFAIKYLGEVKARKSGKEYHNFKAAVRRAA